MASHTRCGCGACGKAARGCEPSTPISFDDEEMHACSWFFLCFSRLMQSARCVQTVMPDKTRGVSPDSCAHVRLFDATRGHGVDGYIPRRGRQNTQPEILPSSLDDCMHAGSGNADLN
jgi:hypothetical protein